MKSESDMLYQLWPEIMKVEGEHLRLTLACAETQEERVQLAKDYPQCFTTFPYLNLPMPWSLLQRQNDFFLEETLGRSEVEWFAESLDLEVDSAEHKEFMATKIGEECSHQLLGLPAFVYGNQKALLVRQDIYAERNPTPPRQLPDSLLDIVMAFEEYKVIEFEWENRRLILLRQSIHYKDENPVEYWVTLIPAHCIDLNS